MFYFLLAHYFYFFTCISLRFLCLFYILYFFVHSVSCLHFLMLHRIIFSTGQTKDSIATVAHVLGRRELRAVLHAGKYTHALTRTYAYTHTRSYTYTYTCMHIHTHTCTYIQIHIHTYTYICKHIHTHTYMYTNNTYICVYTFID